MHVKQKRYSVCYNCPDRHIGCHSDCGKYKEEVDVNLKSYEERRNASDINNALRDSEHRRITSKVYRGKFCHKK